jgi:hypothetical protein
MDPTHALAYVNYMSTGVYSLLGFYNEFIKADATSGVAAQEAYIRPLLNWYRAACIDNNTGESAIAVNPVASALPLQNLLLQAWATSGKCLGCFIRRGMFALCGEIKHHPGRFSSSHGFSFRNQKKTT